MVKLLKIKSQNKGKSHQLRGDSDDCIELEIIFLANSDNYVFKTRLEDASVQIIPYLDKGLNYRASLPVVYSEPFFTYLVKVNRFKGVLDCLRSDLSTLDKFKYLFKILSGKKTIYKYRNYIIYNQITKAAIKTLGDQNSERFVSLLDTLDLWVD